MKTGVSEHDSEPSVPNPKGQILQIIELHLAALESELKQLDSAASAERTTAWQQRRKEIEAAVARAQDLHRREYARTRGTKP